MLVREKWKERHKYLLSLLLFIIIFQSVVTAFSLNNQASNERHALIKVSKLKTFL